MSQLEKISTLLLLQFGVKILEFLQRYGPGDLASDSKQIVAKKHRLK